MLLDFGFVGGWLWQSSKVTALQDTMSGLQHLAYRDGPGDAQQWLALMAYNHMRDVTGRDCRVVVVNARRRCDTSIWLDPDPAPAKANEAEFELNLLRFLDQGPDLGDHRCGRWTERRQGHLESGRFYRPRRAGTE